MNVDTQINWNSITNTRELSTRKKQSNITDPSMTTSHFSANYRTASTKKKNLRRNSFHQRHFEIAENGRASFHDGSHSHTSQRSTTMTCVPKQMDNLFSLFLWSKGHHKRVDNSTDPPFLSHFPMFHTCHNRNG